MRFWPLETSNDADLTAVIFAAAAMVVTLTLAALRAFTYSRKTRARDLVMIGVHLTSALSALGFILLHCYYEESDQVLCRLNVSMQYSGEYLRRSFACGIYYLRLNALIGPVYPGWLKYAALVPIAIMLLFWILALEIINSSGEISEIDSGHCGSVEQHVTSILIDDACVVLVTVGMVISISYLALFLIPLLKYSNEYLGRSNRKHFQITVVDIFAELVFLVLLIGGEHSSTVWAGLAMLYGGVIIGNVLLIFVFADWRRCFCIPEIERKPSVGGGDSSIILTPIAENARPEENLEAHLLSRDSSPVLVLS